MSSQAAPARRRQTLTLIGILLALQTSFSLLNTIRSSANLAPSELAQDLFRSAALLGVTVLYWLVLLGKVKGGFRKVVLVATWVDLLTTGLLLVLFGVLFSRMFLLPLVFMAAAALFPWAIRTAQKQ